MDLFPDKEQCKKLNLYDAINYVSHLIDLLEKSSISGNYNIYNLILRISTSFYDYYHKFIDKICDEYRKRNLVDLIIFFLKSQNKISTKTDDTIHLMYLILVNFSVQHVEFAKLLENSNHINYIIDEYLQIDFSNIEDCKNNRIFKDLITIIHNYSSYNFNKINHKNNEMKSRFLKIIRLNCDDYFGVISLLTLSYLIEDDEVKLLDDSVYLIKKLIEKIKFTSENTWRSEGFTNAELINGLRQISANDELKKIIDNENGIQILINILNDTNNAENIIEPTLDCIKQLCFNDDIKWKLIHQYKIKEILLKFLQSNYSTKIIKHCNGILWLFNDNKPESSHNKNTENSEIDFDVFISYCWANKEKVFEIYNQLKSYKIRIWIDEEEMISSTLGAMATGIESSRVVVIAASSAYKSSSNCRLEAEYAWKINKPIIPLVMEHKYKPRNWLGILCGSKIYYEFSEHRNAEEQVKKLWKAIQYHAGQTLVQTLPEKIDKNQLKSRVTMSKIVMGGEVNKWSCENVADWLEKIGMGKLNEKFIGVDGSLLEVMFDIRVNSADYFNNSLKNEYNMSFIEVVRFHRALNDLMVL